MYHTLTGRQVKLPCEWRIKIAVQGDPIPVNAGKQTVKVASICAEAQKGTNTEHAVRVDAKQVVLIGRQIYRLDQSNWKVIRRVFPQAQFLNPLQPAKR